MKYSLLPELTEAKKQAVGNWVRATLEDSELSQNSVSFDWSGDFVLYRNGKMVALHRNSQWQQDGNVLYIGNRSISGTRWSDPPAVER